MYHRPHVHDDEHPILDEINKLANVLTNYTTKCTKIKQENQIKLRLQILKLQEYKKLIQNAFDAINNLSEKCNAEINTDEKQFEILSKKINKQSNDLQMYQNQLKKYLNKHCKDNNYNDQQRDNININTNANTDINISNDMKQTKLNINKLLCNESITPIKIKNTFNVDQFIYELITKINDSISIKRKIESSYNSENKEMASGDDNMIIKAKEEQQHPHVHQKEFEQRNGENLQMNKYNWKFNFHYDFENKGSQIHGISNNGKSIKCNWRGYYFYDCCCCFSSMSNIEMKPNSGIYTIKIQINKINNQSYLSNIIGITSEKYDNNNNNNIINNNHIDNNIINQRDKENVDDIKSYTYTWHDESNNNFLGWSSCDYENDKELPNGIFCGFGSGAKNKNIFYKNNFLYKSNNGNYKNRLPGFKTGDILKLSYNSVLSQLSFFKENDNGNLNSSIVNLPQNRTFYWFVAHYDNKPMSISILD